MLRRSKTGARAAAHRLLLSSSFSVQPPPPDHDSGSSSSDFSRLAFHYTVAAEGDETAGPVDFEELLRLFAEGRVNASTLVWYDGMGDTWSAVSEVKGLRRALEHGDAAAAASALRKEPSSDQGLDQFKNWADATTSGPKFWLNEVRQMLTRKKDDENKEAKPEVQLTDEQLGAEIWHYAPTGKQSQHGPVSLREMQRLYTLGEIDRRCSVWREGFETWCVCAPLEPWLVVVAVAVIVVSVCAVVRRARAAERLPPP